MTTRYLVTVALAALGAASMVGLVRATSVDEKAVRMCTDACGYGHIGKVTHETCECSFRLPEPPRQPDPPLTTEMLSACRATCLPCNVTLVVSTSCHCETYKCGAAAVTP